MAGICDEFVLFLNRFLRRLQDQLCDIEDNEDEEEINKRIKEIEHARAILRKATGALSMISPEYRNIIIREYLFNNDKSKYMIVSSSEMEEVSQSYKYGNILNKPFNVLVYEQ